ncbi:MAG: PAS domain S-box protein [Verrucomicrobia bacterium]|nr:PAS domain S-box protein [Verrucomicrobiota bacterium]
MNEDRPSPPAARAAAGTVPPDQGEDRWTPADRDRTIVSLLADAVWAWELNPNRFEWHEGRQRCFGYESAAEARTFDFWEERLHPEDRSRVQRRLRTALAGAEGAWADRFRFRCRNGTYAHVEAHTRILREAEGKPIRLVGALTDITERAQRELEIEHAVEMQAGIVRLLHDLTTRDFDLSAALQLVASRTLELVRASGVALDLVEGSDVVCRAAVGAIARQPGDRGNWPGPLADEALRAGKLVVCADAEVDPRVDRAACRAIGARSVVVLPVRLGEGALGLLKAVSQRADAFRAGETSNLLVLAGAVGAVIQRYRAIGQLRVSESNYRLIFEQNPQPMWTFDARTLRFLAVNRAAIEHYGYSAEEFAAMSLRDLHLPEDVRALERAVSQQPPGEKSFSFWRHRRKDGSVISVEVSSDSLQLDGATARLVLAQDVTERVRTERELAQVHRTERMLSRCHEALVRAASEHQLLEAICSLAVDVGGFRMAWVGYAQQDAGRTIVPMAHAGPAEDYLGNGRLSWDKEQINGRGPAGRAVRTGEVVICEDVQKEGEADPWLHHAARCGFRGLAYLPIRDLDRVLGAMGLLSHEPLRLHPSEVRLLRQLADDLAFGLSTIRARQARQRTLDAILTTARGVSASIGSAYFPRLMESMAAALGAPVGLVAEFLPGHARARTISVVVDGQHLESFEYDIVDTPSACIEREQLCVVERGLCDRFPADPWLQRVGAQAYVGTALLNSEGHVIGVVAVMYRAPIAEPEFISSTLRIFGARASAELERKRADAQVREQASLLDKAQDAILVRDLQHRITYWNKSAERLHGWTADEVLGRGARDFLYRDQAAFDESTAKALESGEWTGEMEHLTKDGRTLEVECRLTLVRDEGGAPTSILAIHTNVTERKKLEAQFLRAQRMESIGTLAGGIAHDLNNVLAPILMSVQLLQDELKDEQGRALLEVLETSCQHGADLVRQVLSFARGVKGQRALVNPRHLVRDIQKIIADTFPKNVEFTFRPDRSLWMVTGDSTQLHQVFMNLCVNARDAMPGGGRLTITMRNAEVDEVYAGMNPEARPGNYVVVEVADTGSGIPRALRDRIFEPFFTTKEMGRGTGLGLSTTMAIVKSHGGFINVVSEVGRGTNFEVFLPANVEGAAEAAESSAGADLPRGQGQLVLVVDDEAGIRQVAKSALERFGYRVLLATNGAEAIALHAMHREEIAVVLIDMSMPVMDGSTAIVAIRAINPQVRIIASSGLTSREEIDSAVREGRFHFVPKPYTAEKILRVLSEALGPEPGGTAESGR